MIRTRKIRILGGRIMLAVWIIGVLFLIIGLIFSIPTFIKFIKCKGHTTGKIVSIDNSSDKNAREYLNML